MLLIAVALLFTCINVVPEGNAWIIERLGKFHKIWNTGIHLKAPFIDRIANTVSIDYSYYQKSEFRYDPKSATYKRCQTLGYKEAQQVDSLGTSDTSDDEPLEYKNVIIQFVEAKTDASTNNYEINTVSSGEGYYFTNGTYEPIKWSKSDHYDSTIYTDLAGNVIDFNRGKTWIAIVPKNIVPTISEELKDATIELAMDLFGDALKIE